MEKISTPSAALLPRAANLLTLVAVVVATWWSGAQRPPDQPAAAIAVSPSSVAVAPSQRNTTDPAADATAPWPTDATVLPREGLQIVGYRARSQH